MLLEVLLCQFIYRHDRKFTKIYSESSWPDSPNKTTLGSLCLSWAEKSVLKGIVQRKQGPKIGSDCPWWNFRVLLYKKVVIFVETRDACLHPVYKKVDSRTPTTLPPTWRRTLEDSDPILENLLEAKQREGLVNGRVGLLLKPWTIHHTQGSLSLGGHLSPPPPHPSSRFLPHPHSAFSAFLSLYLPLFWTLYLIFFLDYVNELI